MLRKSLPFWATTLTAVTLCSTSFSNPNSSIETSDYCGMSPRHNRVSARYTTPKGIGYNHGYTTLEGFFSPRSLCRDAWLPFLDVRGHVFDNGKLAANAGLGLRYLRNSRIWGINSYYDYRNTTHQHYNQFSAGLETLGRIWDFRLNGYLPVGWKQSPYYHTQFEAFKGNSLILRSARNFALKGANAEAGFHLDHFKKAPMYFALGPYYLTGKGASTWGGELRASVELFNRYVRLEGNTGYDHFFHWNGQGQISINIPFGGKKKVMRHGSSSCAQAIALSNRLVQPVDRNEIIPVGKTDVLSAAIDPATGKPYFFLFVNNTSHSLGTFESPYATLIDAQNASSPNTAIYVFSGDGTSMGMNAGITLQQGQMLLGSGIGHSFPTTLGSVSIPAFTSAMPVITNTAAAPVVTLSSNNVVSGLYIENSNGNGFYGSGITNFTATQNSIVGGGAATGSGEAILLNDISGQLNVSNTLISQVNPTSSAGYMVHIVQTGAQCDANLTNNTMYAQYNGMASINGINVTLNGTGSVGTLTIANTSLLNSSGVGIALQATLNGSGNISEIDLSNSTINYWGSGIELDLLSTGSISNLQMLGASIISSKSNAGLYANLTSSGSIGNLIIENSNIINGGSSIYGIELSIAGSGGIQNLSVTGSTLNNNSYGIYAYLSGTGGMTTFDVRNSTLNNNGNGVYIDLPFGSSASITNCNVISSNLSYSGSAALTADIAGSGTITNFTVSNSTFMDNPAYGIAIYPTPQNSIQNMTISNSSFSGSEYAIIPDGGGSLGTFDVDQCDFTRNQYTLYIDSNIDAFNITNSNFTGNEYGVYGGPASTGSITNNQFIGNSYGGLVLEFYTNSSFSVVNNVFTGISIPSQGYAAHITPNGNTICLEFINNVSAPVQDGAFSPYFFDGTSGTFNITPNSTQGNNIGTISTSGTIGSCTE